MIPSDEIRRGLKTGVWAAVYALAVLGIVAMMTTLLFITPIQI